MKPVASLMNGINIFPVIRYPHSSRRMSTKGDIKRDTLPYHVCASYSQDFWNRKEKTSFFMHLSRYRMPGATGILQYRPPVRHQGFENKSGDEPLSGFAVDNGTAVPVRETPACSNRSMSRRATPIFPRSDMVSASPFSIMSP